MFTSLRRFFMGILRRAGRIMQRSPEAGASGDCIQKDRLRRSGMARFLMAETMPMAV